MLIGIGLVFPTWTPGIKGSNSVSMLKQVTINGTKQEVMIRGRDRSNPLVIFVHGGPGVPETPYVRKYQDLLEQNFTVVQYDQRGSGKSYHFSEDYSDLSADVLVEDLLSLTDELEQEFGQEKVLLIGHSFGTYIALQAADKAPDKFSAYIGIGQMAGWVSSELESLQFVIDQAKLAGNDAEADQLELLRGPVTAGEKITPRDTIRKYGGSARQIDDVSDLFKGLLFGTEYNLLDAVRFFKGNMMSETILMPEVSKSDLTEMVEEIDIPVYFVMGKYDLMTPVNEARRYLEELKAPQKEFVVFDQSAHYPQFEEKAKFAQWLNGTWAELAQ
ncbi:alpha/beta hydrolase [Paenibacillus sp. MMS20-IR301]|uniref:alpha/beta fold hydrolase n=1 Tax=Paenibacillus sp. MMS20-IR301 TaxID=2895946 RepID=UPI0028EEBFF2|nr:alpha/beta hydrolase [Paenibacillus sp. MMS20-IR301]WNS46294.1 alpha/beta hydrolase [Paenibacillus sp. MMS20-IR301]